MMKAVALMVAALVASAQATNVIKVVNGVDSKSGSCPGSTCNLRAAIAAATLNTTIMVTVDSALDSGITRWSNWPNSGSDGHLQIIGVPPSPHVRVISVYASANHDGSGALYLDDFNSGSLGTRVTLMNLGFSGFTFNKDISLRFQGATVLVGSTQHKGTPASQKMPWFTADNVVFENNFNNIPGSGDYNTGAALWVGLFTEADFKVSLNRLVFRNNTVRNDKDEVALGAAIAITSSGKFTKNTAEVSITDSLFMKNHLYTPDGSVVASSTDGVTISISGCSFAGNLGGGGRGAGVVINNPEGDVFLEATSIYQNQATGSVAKDTAIIKGSHIHSEGVVISNPDSRIPVTWSINDQYFSECDISNTKHKSLAVLQGFQIYNRNPTRNMVTNGTNSQGFATCTEAASWLACPPGTICTDVTNIEGEYCGYRCD